jgi:hypothetical protein
VIQFRAKSGGRVDCAGDSDSSPELWMPAQRHIWLRPVLAMYDRVQEQSMDTGPGTLAKRSFDSLRKSIYTS